MEKNVLSEAKIDYEKGLSIYDGILEAVEKQLEKDPNTTGKDVLLMLKLGRKMAGKIGEALQEMSKEVELEEGDSRVN